MLNEHFECHLNNKGSKQTKIEQGLFEKVKLVCKCWTLQS